MESYGGASKFWLRYFSGTIVSAERGKSGYSYSFIDTNAVDIVDAHVEISDLISFDYISCRWFFVRYQHSAAMVLDSMLMDELGAATHTNIECLKQIAKLLLNRSFEDHLGAINGLRHAIHGTPVDDISIANIVFRHDNIVESPYGLRALIICLGLSIASSRSDASARLIDLGLRALDMGCVDVAKTAIFAAARCASFSNIVPISQLLANGVLHNSARRAIQFLISGRKLLDITCYARDAAGLSAAVNDYVKLGPAQWEADCAESVLWEKRLRNVLLNRSKYHIELRDEIPFIKHDIITVNHTWVEAPPVSASHTVPSRSSSVSDSAQARSAERRVSHGYYEDGSEKNAGEGEHGVSRPRKRIVKKFAMDLAELEQSVQASMGTTSAQELDLAIAGTIAELSPNSIVKGKVLRVLPDGTVVVDVRYKAEGRIPTSEFDDPASIVPGMEIEALVEDVEDGEGHITLSKRKADRIRGWEKIISTHKEGDVVKGSVQRKIKGGLLVDIGVPVFLPASQVNIRRTGDIGDWIGKEIEARIIKIDEERMNIVISRRKLFEEDRERLKTTLLSEIQEGEVRKGTVKNIADFGVFVDLGGIDGLLHITDMSWGRINHPTEMVQIDQEIEVKVLKVDRERERIALGMKQKSPSPWENIDTKYPVAARVTGEVVSLMSYGAFVKLEDGVEGLVHISEMSWTKRVNMPSEVVNVGDKVEVVVLEVNKEKQEISLGMKQTEVNPWTMVSENYPPGTVIRGKVRNLTNYGAFIELQEGIDGLLHITDMSWTKKVSHPSEIVKKGDEVECVVLSVDQEKKRIALGLKQLQQDPWASDIPARYHIGDSVPGTVTKITNFGVFVELEQGLEGLLHISELADHKVDNPEEVVKPGQRVEVRIIKIDSEERKIGLTLIQAHFEAEEEAKDGSPKEAKEGKEPKEPKEKAAPRRAPEPAVGSLADKLKGLGQRVSEREKKQAAESAGQPETEEKT